jgi:hypothetical protein
MVFGEIPVSIQLGNVGLYAEEEAIAYVMVRTVEI